MFEGECRSFIVFFPTEKVLLENETTKIINKYCPFCKELSWDLHFTLCYFNANLDTCIKISDSISAIKELPKAIEISLSSVKFSFLENQNKSMFWWDIPKSDEIAFIRESFLSILKSYNAEIDHEESWTPHMNICNIPGRINENSANGESKIEPLTATFQYLQLSRMLPDNNSFEVVKSWKLEKNEQA